VYSPVQQTKLVAALARMKGTADSGHFVKFAVLARTAQAAFFRARQAAMYANFHGKNGRIERFVPVGPNAAARLANGTMLFCFPTDYLVWTEANAVLASALDRQVGSLSETRGKEIRLTGGISPRARESLEALGWKVYDQQKSLAD
jgi:hypothetical protein